MSGVLAMQGIRADVIEKLVAEDIDGETLMILTPKTLCDEPFLFKGAVVAKVMRVIDNLKHGSPSPTVTP